MRDGQLLKYAIQQQQNQPMPLETGQLRKNLRELLERSSSLRGFL